MHRGFSLGCVSQEHQCVKDNLVQNMSDCTYTTSMCDRCTSVPPTCLPCRRSWRAHNAMNQWYPLPWMTRIVCLECNITPCYGCIPLNMPFNKKGMQENESSINGMETRNDDRHMLCEHTSPSKSTACSAFKSIESAKDGRDAMAARPVSQRAFGSHVYLKCALPVGWFKAVSQSPVPRSRNYTLTLVREVCAQILTHRCFKLKGGCSAKGELGVGHSSADCSSLHRRVGVMKATSAMLHGRSSHGKYDSIPEHTSTRFPLSKLNFQFQKPNCKLRHQCWCRRWVVEESVVARE